MKFFATVRVTKSFRRGSALLLALVLTIALFIMGLVFVSTTQIQKETVSRVDELQTLDTAVDTVIGRINNVLVGDLLGGDSDMLNNDASDEYYDYPGPDDPWLASLEPSYVLLPGGTDLYYWKHITDLYQDVYGGNAFGLPTTDVWFSPESRDLADAWQWDATAEASWPYRIDLSNQWNAARISGEEEGTEVIRTAGAWDIPDDIWLWGAQADADGDGVADSRWVKVPNLTGPRGQNVYTAVRIIDNGGMININTANKFDSSGSDGSRLTDINLLNVTKEGSSPPTEAERNVAVDYLNDVRCGGDGTGTGLNPTDYNDKVAVRLQNPDPTLVPSVLPFDISDELELRNRGFIDSHTMSRLDVHWKQTFLPGHPNNLITPYDDDVDLPIWYTKASEGSSGHYTRRHICTTYSFDRVMVPKPNNWDTDMPTDLKTAWETWTDWNKASGKWSYRPVCVNDYVPGASDPCAVTIEQIAAAIWLGLPKNADLITNSQMVELGWTGTNERDRLACQLAVNMIDYLDSNDNSTLLTVGSNKYYGFESEGENVYINKLGISFYTYDDGVNPPEPHTHYAISIYNPSSDTTGIGWKLDVNQAQQYDLPAIGPGTTVFIDADSSVDPDKGFTVAGDGGVAIQEAGFQYNDGDRIVLLDPCDRPADSITVDSVPVFATAINNQRYIYYNSTRSGRIIGDDVINIIARDPCIPATPWDGPEQDVAQLIDPCVPASTTAPIQIISKNTDVVNIGKIYEVMLVGSMYTEGKYTTMPECWYKFIQTDDDIPAADIHKGRPDAADPCFVNLTRFLTAFNPFSDTVDNDGDGETDENSELAIAGRININTAPWFVIAQLPWVVDPTAAAADKYKLAQAIVAYRDKTAWDVLNYSTSTWAAPDDVKTRKHGMGLKSTDRDIREEIGFANIAELLNVTHNLNNGPGDLTTPDEYYDIRRYGRDDNAGVPKNNNESVPHDPDPGPFLNDNDDAANDLKERDIIFQRISNLVTVRSDVFTAYIMVRVGELGPQKRVIAIFDRSNVYNSDDTPKLVALHPVPDPR